MMISVRVFYDARNSTPVSIYCNNYSLEVLRATLVSEITSLEDKLYQIADLRFSSPNYLMLYLFQCPDDHPEDPKYELFKHDELYAIGVFNRATDMTEGDWNVL